jgi:hypothetical protein
MNLREVKKHVQANILAGNSTVVQGPPGFGKTDLSSQLIAWWARQNSGKRVGMSCFFMATQTPIGFTGLPWKGEREYDGKRWTVTDPAIPLWYMATDVRTGEQAPASCFDTVFLIIEEWGQGSPETKRAGAEVLRAGGTPPYYLPVGSPRMALTNVDARDGVTKEYDFIIGRRCQLEVHGDVDIWIEDFADKPYVWQGQQWFVQGVTKAWAKGNPGILFEPKPEKQGPWCNPRSLTNADRYVQALTNMSGGTLPLNDSGFVETIAGYIGMNAGSSYISHLKFALDLPHYEDIVKDPAGTPIPAKADMQTLIAYELAGRCKVAHLAEVLKYMGRLPKDMSIAFVTSLLRRDYRTIIGEPAMQAWISKNAHLVALISSLSQ